MPQNNINTYTDGYNKYGMHPACMQRLLAAAQRGGRKPFTYVPTVSLPNPNRIFFTYSPLEPMKPTV